MIVLSIIEVKNKNNILITKVPCAFVEKKLSINW